MANLLPDVWLREREVGKGISKGGTEGLVGIHLLLELIAMGERLKHPLSFPVGKLVVQEPGKIFARHRRV
jgi:hypothetical protein